MSEEEKLQLENECLLKYSKAQMIQKYIDELEENCTLSDLWCKSQEENKRLNNIINEKDKDFEILRKSQLKKCQEYKVLEKLNNANYQSFIEVNNIINELEKEFEEELKNLNYSEDKIYAQGIHDTIISHKYKLQELKGVDKK